MSGKAWIAVAVLAVALAGCEVPRHAPPVTLRVGVFQTQDLLPYVVIQEQGFDKENGLRFEETSYSGGAAAIDAMVAGTIDMCPGVGIAPLFAAVERGLIPDKAVAVAVNNFADPEHPGVSGPPFERTVFTSIVFSAEFRRRNPDGVKAFLRAHLAAARWINDHPDEVRLVLARRLNLSAEVVKKVKFLHVPLDARTDPALLDHTQQVLLRAGILQRPVDTRRLHDDTLLAEVLKETR
jgi:ABC-type nitrate/sulfonate/bicarbonate transport system substrate-binding protein